MMNEQVQLGLFNKKSLQKKYPAKDKKQQTQGFALSPIQRRSLAFMIDLLIVKAIVHALMAPAFSYYFLMMGKLQLQVRKEFWLSLWTMETVLTAAVFWGHYILAHYWGNGHSLGKIILGLRLVSNKTPHLKLRHLIARSSLYTFLLSVFPVILFLPILWREKKTLPDYLINQSVIDEKDFLHNRSLMAQELKTQANSTNQLKMALEVYKIPFVKIEKAPVQEILCPVVELVKAQENSRDREDQQAA